jgi:hypothetical protein
MTTKEKVKKKKPKGDEANAKCRVLILRMKEEAKRNEWAHRQGTPFFRAVNFELFMDPTTRTNRIISLCGTIAFLGALSYLWYDQKRLQYNQEQEELLKKEQFKKEERRKRRRDKQNQTYE